MQPRFATVLHQCKNCRASAKQRHHFIDRVGENEYLLLIDICEDCIEGNISLANTFQRFWPPSTFIPTAIKKLKTSSEESNLYSGYQFRISKIFFVSFSDSYVFANEDAPDDKRLAAGRYVVNIFQCDLCLERQKKMCPDFFIRNNINKENGDCFLLAFMQCLTCISGNYCTMRSKKTNQQLV